MSFRSNIAQLGFKVQAAEGTEESLIAADYFETSSEVKVTYDSKRYARANTRPTFSKLPGVPTMRSIGIAGKMEMTGGSATVQAPWWAMLRMCGYAVAVVKSIAVGSVSGDPFTFGMSIGDTASAGSATKKGTILGVAAAKLWYIPIGTAFANSDTIYGYQTGGSQPTATATAGPAAGGWYGKPVDPNNAAETECGTIDYRVRGESQLGIDMRADGSIMFESGKPAILNFDAKGVAVLDETDPTKPRPRRPSPALVANVPALPSPDPVRGMFLSVNATTVILTQTEVKFGAEVSERESIANDTLKSGMVAPRHTDRKVQLVFNPEFALGGDGDINSRGFYFGTATMPARAIVGAPTNANGQVVVDLPALEVESQADADRNKIATLDITANATSTTPAGEILIAQLF